MPPPRAAGGALDTSRLRVARGRAGTRLAVRRSPLARLHTFERIVSTGHAARRTIWLVVDPKSVRPRGVAAVDSDDDEVGVTQRHVPRVKSRSPSDHAIAIDRQARHSFGDGVEEPAWYRSCNDSGYESRCRTSDDGAEVFNDQPRDSRHLPLVDADPRPAASVFV
jgi:hypothetical protein